MKWQVTIDDEVKDVELPKGSTSNDLVRHLDLHPDGLLVVTDEETMKPVPLVSKLLINRSGLSSLHRVVED